MTPIEFALARLNERAQRWKLKPGAPDHSTENPEGSTKLRVTVAGFPPRTMTCDEYVEEFYAPPEPPAEVAALRQIVELHIPGGYYVYRDDGTFACDACGDYTVPWPCPTLRAVLAIWAGHGDYDPSWSGDAAE